MVNASRLIIPLFMLALALTACQPQTSEPANTESLGFLQAAEQDAAYAQARPGVPLVFPRDHGAHDDYRLEWWYLTANLERASGERLGLQWTLFRSALSPEPESQSLSDNSQWLSRQVYMLHVAISMAEEHVAHEAFSRAGMGLAGVETEPFRAWLESSSLVSATDQLLPMTLEASVDDYQVNLTISGQGQPVLQGERGFSRKHPEQLTGSFYYSLPHLEITGELITPSGSESVTGQAWLDREWSSGMLADDQQGWDWLSLHLDSGEAVMLYRLRNKYDAADDYLAGYWINADSQVEPLKPADIQWTALANYPVAGRALPLDWRLEIPSREVSITVKPLNRQSWMDLSFPYWEGPVYGSGTHDVKGYLELTGYPESG